MSAFTMELNASAPDTPASGFLKLYPKADKKWYAKDDGGNERPLTPVIGQTRTGYVDPVRGNDATGLVGDLNAPFQTIAAAEAAIIDASDTNIYNLVLSLGTHDVQGLVKKANICWSGAGNTWISSDRGMTIIKTGDSSTLNLVDAAMASNESMMMIQDLTIQCAISIDTYSLGAGLSHATFIFNNVSTFSPFAVIGRGADHDTIIAQDMNFDDGFDITSVNMRGACVFCAGGTNFRADHGNGAQWLTSGSEILSAMTVQSVDGVSYVLFAIVGSIVGGSLTVDGAAAQVYIDSGSVISGSVTQVNSGVLNLVSKAKFVEHIALDPSLYLDNTALVSSALDATALRILNAKVRSINADYTVDTDGDGKKDEVILVDTSGAAVTVTLPTPTDGRRLTFKDKTGSFLTNNFILAGGNIDGVPGGTYLINFQAIRLVAFSGDWYSV